MSNSNYLKLNEMLNNIIINNKTTFITHKIQKKIEIINSLIYLGFTILHDNSEISKEIINKLTLILTPICADIHINSKINSKINSNFNNNIIECNDELNKILGDIIHDCYSSSGFQILFTNIPEYSYVINEPDILEKINCENIYDTINNYIDSSAIHVCQLTSYIYIAKINTDENAIYICNLLNNTMINKNTINVVYLKQKIEHLEEPLEEPLEEHLEEHLEEPLDEHLEEHLEEHLDEPLAEPYVKQINNSNNFYQKITQNTTHYIYKLIYYVNRLLINKYDYKNK
jgi:hypothetical protein